MMKTGGFGHSVSTGCKPIPTLKGRQCSVQHCAHQAALGAHRARPLLGLQVERDAADGECDGRQAVHIGAAADHLPVAAAAVVGDAGNGLRGASACQRGTWWSPPTVSLAGGIGALPEGMLHGAVALASCGVKAAWVLRQRGTLHAGPALCMARQVKACCLSSSRPTQHHISLVLKAHWALPKDNAWNTRAHRVDGGGVLGPQ